MSGQGRFLSRRVERSPIGTIVTDHVVERFWERFPDSRHLSNEETRALITKHVDDAVKKKTLKLYRRGWWAPLTYMGEDGWVLVGPNGYVVTVITEDMMEDEKNA